MSASHAHGIPSTDNERALRIALALTGSFLIAEVIGGELTGSLALISYAGFCLKKKFRKRSHLPIDL